MGLRGLAVLRNSTLVISTNMLYCCRDECTSRAFLLERAKNVDAKSTLQFNVVPFLVHFNKNCVAIEISNRDAITLAVGNFVNKHTNTTRRIKSVVIEDYYPPNLCLGPSMVLIPTCDAVSSGKTPITGMMLSSLSFANSEITSS